MIIEFTGVPCSGKSDISHELAVLLRNNGYSVCEKQYELSHTKESKIRAIQKAISGLSYGLKHPRKSLKLFRLMGSVKHWLNYTYLLSHRCKEEICILEQGYLQLIASFFDNCEPNEKKMEYLFENLIPNTDIIQCFVLVSKGTVLERAKAREDKPFFIQSNTPETSLDFSLATNKMLQTLWSQNMGSANFISVSNEKDDAQYEVAEKIYDILMQKDLL